MKDVYSSHVDQVGHDPQTNELHVKWDSGKTSVYSNVPAELAQSVVQSWSVGKALTAQVKGQFPHRYL